MREVNERFFCREIQYAHMICAVEHGHLVAVRNENPYKRKRFHPVANSRFYFWDCEAGAVLKLTVKGVTKLMAFRMSDFSNHKALFQEEMHREPDLFDL